MRPCLTRRDFLGAIGAHLTTIALAHSLLAAEKTPSSKSRPNIVMFISDDHGIEYVGCYGNKTIQTPNIDRLAADGMRFNNMYAASPTCAPSRSVLWTSLYPAHNGCMGNHTVCRTDIRALPSYLSELGYRVALFNKFHAKPRESVFTFEYVKASLPRNPDHHRKYRREGLNPEAVDSFLAEHAKQKPNTPLCLIVADSNPHVTWEPNKEYDPKKIYLPPYIVDTPLTRKAMSNYYQDISTMDEKVGRIRQSLKRHGFENNTLFIYTSDQGSEWPRCKWTLYDSGIRVPFIAAWPGVTKPQTQCDAMISFVDMTAAFIALAGGKQPTRLDGQSFADVLRGKSRSHRKYIFASHTSDGKMNVFPQRCVRDKRYKYILNLHPERTWTTHFTKVPNIPQSHKEVWDTWLAKARTDPSTAKLIDRIEHHPREELYDTQNDPHEMDNIAQDKKVSSVLLRMRKALSEWLIDQGESLPDDMKQG